LIDANPPSPDWNRIILPISELVVKNSNHILNNDDNILEGQNQIYSSL
jgi:hypothetical protein